MRSMVRSAVGEPISWLSELTKQGNYINLTIENLSSVMI